MTKQNECCELCDTNSPTQVEYCDDCPCHTSEPVESWEDRLRDLYLTENPDSKGLYTASITFEWGRFDFSPKEKYGRVAFYLATPSSIEDFIRETLASQKQKQIEEFMSMLEESYQDIQHKLAGGMAESSFGAEVIWEARMGRIKEFRDDILAKLKEGAPKK